MSKTCLFLLALFTFSLTACTTPSQKENIESEHKTPTENPELWGLFWYGPEGERARAEPGQSNPYYDENRPVILFFHGWSYGNAANSSPWNFRYGDADVSIDEGWQDAGYNVGIFHWEIWADEPEYLDAESKIWTRKGRTGFRYRLEGGRFYTEENPEGEGGVGALATEILLEALGQHSTDQEIRFAGHSFGAQLASHVAILLEEKAREEDPRAAHCKVNRLALLDAAWSIGGKNWWLDKDLNDDGCSDSTGERTRWGLFSLLDTRPDFLVEIYNSSIVSDPLCFFLDHNQSLRDRSCEITLKPAFYSLSQLWEQHMYAYFYYMWSFSFPPPVLYEQESLFSWRKTEAEGPSAATHFSIMKEYSEQPFNFIQHAGEKTFSPADNEFRIR